MPDELIEMTFAMEAGRPMLREFAFRAEGVKVRAPGGFRKFLPSGKGVTVLALALVRLCRWRGVRPEHRPPVIPLLISVKRPGLALRLAEALQPRADVKWLDALFSIAEPPGGRDRPTGGGDPGFSEVKERFDRWFVFENKFGDLKDKPTTAGANARELSPEAVTVRMDGRVLDAAALDRLERRLSACMEDKGFPPMPMGGLRVTGYPPMAGWEFRGREQLLNDMDNCYENGRTRMMVLRGAAGAGKTAAAREWLARRAAEEMLRHGMVFCWSFYRQGYSGKSGQLLLDFFQELAEAVGIPLPERLTPAETALAYWEALKRRRLILFLDGLEVLLRAECRQPGGIHDTVLSLLLHHLVTAVPAGIAGHDCFVIATSRDSLREEQGWGFPDLCQMEVGPLRINGQDHSALRWNLLNGFKAEMEDGAGQAAPAAVAKLRAALERQEAGGAKAGNLPTLVREMVDYFGNSAERSILYGASFFDPAPDWPMLHQLLSSTPALPGITDGWTGTAPETWESAFVRLMDLRLISSDERGAVLMHWEVASAIADDLRRYLPEAWRSAHLRLSGFFSALQEKHQPDTLKEMEPLFRALWHGCQAGEQRLMNDTIGRPRLSRGVSGYLLSGLGDAQSGLTLLENFCEDHRTFPPVPAECALDRETQIIIINGCGYCLCPLDRLEEAYGAAKAAWEKITPLSSMGCVAPVANNLLRLQQIFGDVEDSREILKVLRARKSAMLPTPADWELPAGFLAGAVGRLGVAVAAAIWWGAKPNAASRLGRRWMIRLVMRETLKKCAIITASKSRLAPGMALQHHALLLLDMGQWEECEEAEAGGELEGMDLRGRSVRAGDLIRGRWRSLKAAALPSGGEKRNLDRAALDFLHSGLTALEQVGFRWWLASFHLALAEHHQRFGRKDKTGEHAAACRTLAARHGLKLLERQARRVESLKS